MLKNKDLSTRQKIAIFFGFKPERNNLSRTDFRTDFLRSKQTTLSIIAMSVHAFKVVSIY